MASRGEYEVLEERDEGSNASNSNAGSSARSNKQDINGTCGLTASSPPVLEPSKDESRGGIESYKKGIFSQSWPPTSTKEASLSSSGDHSESEDDRQSSGCQRSVRRQNEAAEPRIRRPFCSILGESYNCCVNKIKNSWMIHFLQALVFFQAISALVMGSIYFRACDGSHASSGPTLTLLMAITSLILVYMWVSKTLREHNGERYWNFQKDRLLRCFVVVLFLMALEFMLFSQESPAVPSNVTANPPPPNPIIKCHPIYYYYMYYLHMANAGFLALAALLYLCDCGRFLVARKYLRQAPHTNGHYQPL